MADLRSSVLFIGLAALVTFVALPRDMHDNAWKVHPAKTIDRVWTPQEEQALLQAVRQHRVYRCSTKDSTPLQEDIGEAHDLIPGVGCPHPLMQPNRNDTKCIFAPRMDIGRHYIATGGRRALKEPYQRLVNRLLSFSHFFIGEHGSTEEDLRKMIPGYDSLFNSSEYRQAVDLICPGKPLLDPFQLGIIVQVPGQQVAMHFDAPWFFGADRWTVPVWLLVVMHRSGLFKAETVSQIQGVAYVHDWGAKARNMSDAELNAEFGGSFFHYTAGEQLPPADFVPRQGSAILLNGAECAHGTDLFHPHGDRTPPRMDKSSANEVRYRPATATRSEGWQVVSDNKIIKEYGFSDLRIALVWRSRCFADETERETYRQTPPMATSEILRRLKEDLVVRGKLQPGEEPSPVALGELLIKTYIKYPLPTAVMPYNYCALPELLPAAFKGLAARVLSPLCE